MRRKSTTWGHVGVAATIFACAMVAVFFIAQASASDTGSLARAHNAAPEAPAPERDVQPAADAPTGTEATPVSAGDSAPAQEGKWYVATRLKDRCSGDVVIKKPYAGPNASSLDDDDVILARSSTFCNFVQGPSPLHKGVCVNSSTGRSDWTERELLTPVPANADRYFRWFCGKTAERSRCPSQTKAISSRLGPNRLFETRCWKIDPTQ
jgi:hypothetical protein